MRRLTLAALASATALVIAAPAYADFVAISGVSFEQANFALNLANGTQTQTGSGTDDGFNVGITSFDRFGAATGETFDLAGGNATITPDGTILNAVTFTPTGGVQFTSFTTRGQLLAAGDVMITVVDNNLQTFTFAEAKDQDWTGGIGVEAIAGTGEFIKSVTVWTTGDFKEIKQQTFGFQVAVPAPALGAGLPGILAGCVALWGFAKRRRNERLAV